MGQSVQTVRGTTWYGTESSDDEGATWYGPEKPDGERDNMVWDRESR